MTRLSGCEEPPPTAMGATKSSVGVPVRAEDRLLVVVRVLVPLSSDKPDPAANDSVAELKLPMVFSPSTDKSASNISAGSESSPANEIVLATIDPPLSSDKENPVLNETEPALILKPLVPVPTVTFELKDTELYLFFNET